MMGLSARALSFGLGTALFSTAALGADPPASPPPTELVARERPTTKSFYGWEILVFGEVGGALAAASLVLPESPLGNLPSTVGFLFGMPAYVLGGPIAHWSHGDFTRGMVSLGANALVPLASGLTGEAIACSSKNASDNCGTDGFLAGFGIALITVPIVDALVLGWENVPVEDSTITASSAKRAPSASKVSVAPTWSIGQKGAFQLGLAGRF